MNQNERNEAIRKMDVGPIFKRNWESRSPIVVNQGGSRSGKTYAILQVIILMALQDTGKIYSIARKALKSLKATAMRDFFEILMALGLYDIKNHNRSNGIYYLNGNTIEFIGMDDPQKKRGAKRHVLFANEVNEFTKEDWLQLELRTTGRIFADFNPSDEFHWLYDDVIPRAEFIQSTYKDNPFLEGLTVQRIERLKETDPVAWRVYGLGERAESPDLIFPNVQTAEVPEGAKFIARGMDFGYTNDPTAAIDIWEHNGALYFDELLYQNNLTNADIIQHLRSTVNAFDEATNLRQTTYCDSAEPKSIEELYRLGMNAKLSTKGRDSLNAGIQMMKTYRLYVTARSVNLIKEFRNYKWQTDKNGKRVNIPIDFWNHGIDAARYGVFTSKHSGGTGVYAIR